MAKPMALSTGQLVRMSSGGLVGMSAESAPPPGATAQQVASFYAIKQDTHTDLMTGIRTPWQEVKVSGANWRSQDFYENGHLAADGSLIDLPAGTTQIITFELLSSGFAANPSYYTGRTLVLDLRQGTFTGSGNSFGMTQLGATSSTTAWDFEQFHNGDSSTTAFTFTGAAGLTARQIHVFVGGTSKAFTMVGGVDYTVADSGSDLTVTFTTPPATGTGNIYFMVHRKEYAINTAGWGGNPPRSEGPYMTISIGTPANITDLMAPGVFWKDEEADYQARFDEPRKMIAPWLREWLGNFHVIRPMDLYTPMRQNGAVPADMSEIDDQTISGASGVHLGDFDYDANGLGFRQANVTLPLLDLCKNEYASARVPWINLPNYIGMPFYPAIQSNYVGQSGDSTAYVWLRETVVDFNQTVSISAESVTGVASLSFGGRRLTIDANTLFSHTTGEQSYTCDIDFTDVEGNLVTYILRMRILSWNEGVPGDYLIWCNYANSPFENEVYYRDHWCWDQWADWLLDQLVAAGWSPSAEVIVEIGNEVWNTARPFDPATKFAQGFGGLYGSHESNLDGCGWMNAKFMKHLADRMTARALSFNVTMATGTWTALGGYITAAKLVGYKEFWESSLGGSLTGAPLAAKQAETQVFITNYYSGPFIDDPASNWSGFKDLNQLFNGNGSTTVFTLNNGAGRTAEQCYVEVDSVQLTPITEYTVADSGANLAVTFAVAPASGTNNVQIASVLNRDTVRDTWQADAAAFWDSVYDWYALTEASGVGSKDDIRYRMRWIEEFYDVHQSTAQTYNTTVRGSYEGGSHDDNQGNIPANIQAISGFMASYETYMQGTIGGALWALMAARMRAKDENFMIAAYGGRYEWDAGQPWAQGWYQEALTGYATAIVATGPGE